MQKYVNIATVQLPGPSLVTIGNFDGLHRGHQALLRQMVDLAVQQWNEGELERAPQCGLITFDPHPRTVLRPDEPHYLLTTPDERLALAAAQGIDFGVIQCFSREIAALDARAFMTLLKEHLGVVGLVVGPDFALGRGRQGDLPRLQELGEELGYTLHVMAPIAWEGKAVRSSFIRAALQQGDVSEAADLLGWTYTVTGTVVPGDRRGRQIGVPTANLQVPPNKLLPADGVYATRTKLHVKDSWVSFNSVTNLGVRPTVDGLHHRVETHLLDFPAIAPDTDQTGDLYGQSLIVEFIARLRGEERFSGLNELVAQIQRDIAQARELLSK
ncbi:MAG: bifunctional riboflavin kinase/FAD synthetase [Caldilineaceae bacterium]